MLRIAPCTREAAKHAVMSWHYSKSMPCGKLAMFGVWEHGRYVGAVIYGRGANKNIACPFGLKQTEVVELERVALNRHETPVSRIVSITLRMLKKACPGLRVIVSYADTAQGHTGQIYKAGNWVYMGSFSDTRVLSGGSIVHRRTVYGKRGTTRGSTCINTEQKHKFAYPLDKQAGVILDRLRVTSIGSDAPGDQSGEGGASPTVTLHSSTEATT
jgi:hypothetical protein